MSIHNISDKIKSKIDIDKMTILYLFIIVGVGVSSFALGRLSANNNPEKDNSIIITNKDKVLDNQSFANGDSGSPVAESTNPAGKKYVASKNGKMYYSLGCSGAKRIKPENEVWFSTALEAEKSGYQLSVLCK